MLAEFSIYPIGDEHMSEEVARVVEILEQSGLDYRLGPMGTSIEGDLDVVMETVKQCHRAVADESHARVVTHLVIDDHKQASHSLGEAVARVEQQLGHTIKR